MFHVAGKKRGFSTILYFRVMGLAMAVVVFVVLFNYVNEAASGDVLKRNYFARDIALVITTLYASPGDVTYVYPLDTITDPDTGKKVGTFNVEIANNNVVVSSGKGSAAYWYARPESMADVVLDKHFEPPVAIKFVKAEKSLTAEGVS